MAAVDKNPRAGTVVVPLGTKLHSRLQDRSIKESRRLGEKVPMTDIVRRAVEKELETPLP